jgi:hypothetical protein
VPTRSNRSQMSSVLPGPPSIVICGAPSCPDERWGENRGAAMPAGQKRGSFGYLKTSNLPAGSKETRCTPSET